MKFGIITDIRVARDELAPLLELHWHEVAKYKDIPLEPDWAWYDEMVKGGAYRAYTMRTDEGELIGYAGFVVGGHKHYKSCLCAWADVVFLHPKQRKNAFAFVRFMKWTDEMLKELGVRLVIHRCKIYHGALGDLVEALGYEHVEESFERRLS